MPKRNFVKIKLPIAQPDCCALCPLIGKIPPERREYGSYETLICLGTMDAMTQRQSNIRASKRDSRHPLHRYCDTRWNAWQQLSAREFPVSIDIYNTFRMPYEMGMQPVIRFHRRGRPKKETATAKQRPTEPSQAKSSQAKGGATKGGMTKGGMTKDGTAKGCGTTAANRTADAKKETSKTSDQ